MSRDAPGRERVDGRSPGRPRDAAIDTLVLRATIDLLVERGVEETTIQAVSERTGIARATIYLRWPSRTALILGALRWSINRPPLEPTGDIATDLTKGAEQARTTLLQPLFVAAMPALMQAFLGGDGTSPGLTFDTLFPNRRRLIEEYEQLAAGQGFRSDVEATAVVDTLLGGMFMHLMTRGTPPSRSYARHVVALIVEGTRNRAAE